MRTILHVDVFTDRVLLGNPSCVVLDADDLSDEALFAVTRELGAETVFLTKPTRAGATRRARFFTRGGEVSVSGHGAIAAAFVLHSRGEAGPVVLEARAADLKVVVAPRAVAPAAGGASASASAPPCRFGVTLGKGAFGDLPLRGVVSQAVTLPPDVVAPRPSPGLVSVGEWVVILPVTGPDVLAHAVPLAAKIAALGAPRQPRGLYAVALDSESGPVTKAAARFFGATSFGAPEDAGSGVAAGALAVWLGKNGRLQPGRELLVTQGEGMQRRSQLVARLEEDGRAWIGGDAVLAFESTGYF